MLAPINIKLAIAIDSQRPKTVIGPQYLTDRFPRKADSR